MKKEEKLTPVSSKTRSIYRYELQATNQILKDTLDIYPSSLHSTAQTNRHNNAQLQQFDEYLFEENQSDKYFSDKKKGNGLAFSKKTYIFEDQKPLNCVQNQFEEKQQIKNNRPEGFSKIKLEDIKKEEENDLDAHQSSQIYPFSSDNEEVVKNHTENCTSKANESPPKEKRSEDNRKELKRQRRGLAHISLKVKNIVAKKGKMTYKEVSDDVLEESKEDLPNNNDSQREKEMKNIRRRVYDALNVLVSVGILGKQQRYVVHTEFTNIPGKKLSSYWELINQKNRILKQQKTNYEKKKKDFDLLKINYELIQLFHARNRNCLQTINKSSENHEEDRFIVHPVQERYYFPLIFLIPPKKHDSRIKVHIEYEQQQGGCIKKFFVQGNEYVLTDLDLLKHIPFKEQMEKQDIERVRIDEQFFHADSLDEMRRIDDSNPYIRRLPPHNDDELYFGD